MAQKERVEEECCPPAEAAEGEEIMPRHTGPRRAVEWYDTIELADTIPSNGQGEHDLLVNMEDRMNKGATVTRLILTLDIRPTVVDTFCNLFVGITTWSNEAFLAGIMPDSDDDADMGVGWMYRGRLWTMMSNLTDAPGLGASLLLDLRSQRVLTSEDQSLFLVVDQDASGINLTMNFLARVLIKHR